MARPIGSKNKPKIVASTKGITITPHETEKIIEAPQLKGIALYKALQKAGFPQGGAGYYLQDPNSNDKVYVPQASELYTAFIGNPEDWKALTDTLARGWLENQDR